jgi:hypothetical protein
MAACRSSSYGRPQLPCAGGHGIDVGQLPVPWRSPVGWQGRALRRRRLPLRPELWAALAVLTACAVGRSAPWPLLRVTRREHTASLILNTIETVIFCSAATASSRICGPQPGLRAPADFRGGPMAISHHPDGLVYGKAPGQSSPTRLHQTIIWASSKRTVNRTVRGLTASRGTIPGPGHPALVTIYGSGEWAPWPDAAPPVIGGPIPAGSPRTGAMTFRSSSWIRSLAGGLEVGGDSVGSINGGWALVPGGPPGIRSLQARRRGAEDRPATHDPRCLPSARAREAASRQLHRPAQQHRAMPKA